MNIIDSVFGLVWLFVSLILLGEVIKEMKGIFIFFEVVL